MTALDRQVGASTLTFNLPRALIINANERIHWAPKAAKTRNLRAMARLAALEDGTHLNRAHLTIEIGYPDNRRRDDHNLMPTMKALIDGAVDGGVLADDSREYLTGPDLRGYKAGVPGITVIDMRFEPVPV